MEVKKNSTVIATFVYDGDGKQVKGTVNGVTTYYVGAYYQKQGTQVTKYYYAGAERVAMRQGGVLYYIFGDHLGSTAVVKNTQGGKTELRYTAWGTTRYEYGSTPTDRRFTGQRVEASLGLYFYNARWYDPALGRFIQADTIVPGAGNPQAWDRYAYTSNNPVKYTDPSGHKECADVDSYGNCINEPIEKKRSQPPQPPVDLGKGGEENCRGLECINSYRYNGDTQSSANATDTPPPPNEMTDIEKIGMFVAVAMADIIIILPFEAALVYATFNVTTACGAGAVPACVAAIPLVAADVAVADFGISLTIYMSESISSGHKGQFEWIIIPAIVDMFRSKE